MRPKQKQLRNFAEADTVLDYGMNDCIQGKHRVDAPNQINHINQILTLCTDTIIAGVITLLAHATEIT